ncbi:MAG: UDP-N-acetylenolpyruvoylglucosamine reductase [Parcubacteria group bacterium GW2011_GWA1_53_13]|nr:MAG: UDP-N-acetylenolpyruvoylglucosamine reductase [Parcubacteria group bacterium GW2011_GWA1_53_13]
MKLGRRPALTKNFVLEYTPPAHKGKMEETIQKLLPGVRKQESLSRHTTFRIGGPARYFFTATNSDAIIRALQAAKKLRLSVFILSGGSNVVMSDAGFPGLVIQIRNSKFKIRNFRVDAEAGVLCSSLVKATVHRGLEGLEWAGGLPGSLGGAIRGNAGAFGGEIKDAVVSVEAIDEKGRMHVFSKKQCRFSYRSSIFKEKKYIVLSAVLGLVKGDAKELSKIARSHMLYRKERHPLEYPNAGSMFKNCDAKKLPVRWKKHFANVMKIDPFPVIPTAAIIAAAGLKGLRVGNVQVSQKHPNYIVNLGKGRAKDVVRLVEKVKQKVKKKFGIVLEEEIQFV